MSPRKRTSGRPAEPVLSRELIIAAGRRLLDARGEEALTMRALARELGVRPSSLYNHVADRNDLIAGIRDMIGASINTECFDVQHWDEALTTWADSYREAFAGFPQTIAFFAVAPVAQESGITGMYDRVCRGLLAAGWPAEQVLTIIVAFENLLLGAALDASADPDMLDPGEDSTDKHFLWAFNARKSYLASKGDDPAAAAYRLGRDALLAGLRAEYTRCGYKPLES